MLLARADAFTVASPVPPGAAAPHRKPWRRTEMAAAAANIVIAAAIVVYFHNRFWWPADDGVYAYIADELRNGAVLNRDLHDIHGGYVHFLHALALDIFGRDIASLRYPLALLTVIQSLIVFLLLRPLIGVAATCGGIAMSALTFVQFLNPTANWYALFLAVIVAALLAARFQRSFAGLAGIGFSIGMIFFFRQLTGVLIGMGTLAWLLLSEADETNRGSPILARTVAAIMAAGLAAYAWLKLEGAAVVLYAALPLGFLVVVGLRTRLDDRRLAQILAGIAAGAFLAATPLFLYHAAHGSLAEWWRDITVSAIALTDLQFFGKASYAAILVLAVRGIADLANPAGVLNGAFWLLILLAPAILGAAAVRGLLRGTLPSPLAVVALFYAVVSAHYAIPIYALFSAGFTLAGLLATTRTPAMRAGAAGVTLFAVAVGLVFHAAEPLSRGVTGAILGNRVALDAEGIPGASLRMERQDREIYLDILRFIDTHAGADDPILGLPMTPQLYFLSGRKPPLRFVIAPLGLLSDTDVEQAWDRLAANMPAVLIFRPDDKYMTPRVRALMDRLRPHYQLCGTVGGFEMYAPVCRPGPTGRET